MLPTSFPVRRCSGIHDGRAKGSIEADPFVVPSSLKKTGDRNFSTSATGKDFLAEGDDSPLLRFPAFPRDPESAEVRGLEG